MWKKIFQWHTVTPSQFTIWLKIMTIQFFTKYTRTFYIVFQNTDTAMWDFLCNHRVTTYCHWQISLTFQVIFGFSKKWHWPMHVTWPCQASTIPVSKKFIDFSMNGKWSPISEGFPAFFFSRSGKLHAISFTWYTILENNEICWWDLQTMIWPKWTWKHSASMSMHCHFLGRRNLIMFN